MTSAADCHRITVCLALFGILAAAYAVFQPALSGPFVFDDFPNLENLRQIDGHLSAESVRRYLAAFGGNPGRPLATLSFLIEDSAWPAYPADFKHTNLLLHLLVGLLVFALTRALGTRLNLMPPHRDWMALACTTMWLLHPMQLSATMLVVQRMNILSTLFMLLGLLIYLRILAAHKLSDFARVALAGVSLSTFGVLAFLCKENGLLIFAYATALNVTVLRVQLRNYAPISRRVLIVGTAAPLVAFAITVLVKFDAINAVYGIRDFDMGERLLTEARVVVDYLRLIYLPRIGGLSVFHDDYVVSRSLLHPPSTLLAVLGITFLLITALALRRRSPVYSFAVLWFFAGHLLESTVVALELYFEHRNYMPMVGPLFALGWLLFSVQPPWRGIARAFLIAWIAVCALLSWMNAGVWGDRSLLAAVWWAENPRSMRAVQMVASDHAERGDYVAARRTLDTGITNLPEAKELVFQRALLDCFYVGISPAIWEQLSAAARTAARAGAIPQVIARLLEQSLGSRCHGTLDPVLLNGLVIELMKNQSIASDKDAMGFLHYELVRPALADRDLNRVMYHLDEAYRYRQSPLVPREQAIYLLSAGLPQDALHYLDRSESTPQPIIKRLLLDMPTRNKRLRQSARKMIEIQSKAPEVRH